MAILVIMTLIRLAHTTHRILVILYLLEPKRTGVIQINQTLSQTTDRLCTRSTLLNDFFRYKGHQTVGNKKALFNSNASSYPHFSTEVLSAAFASDDSRGHYKRMMRYSAAMLYAVS